MISEIKNKVEERMIKCINFFKYKINKINTGRASTDILNDIKVNCYNNITKLKQLASITVENALTLKINLFDTSLISVVEKEIINSNLGVNVISKSKTIRVFIPSLTEERRKQLIKIIKLETEQSKILIRNIRREFNDALKEKIKIKKISMDYEYKIQEIIQKLTNIYTKKIEDIYILKEIELKKN